MKAALAQTTVDQQAHIFLEFPAAFICICDKKMCLLTSFSVSFLNIYQKDLGNFNNKNKTLHLQNNDVTTKFQQLWRHVSQTFIDSQNISQHLYAFYSYFTKSTHILFRRCS